MRQHFHQRFWQLLAKAGFRVFGVHRRAVENSVARTPPAGIRVELGSQAQMLAYTEQEALELTPAFVREAFARNHLVVLTYFEEQLVAYGWVSYASAPHVDGWWVDFAPGHRYNYKNLTLPAFRGRRLRGSFGLLIKPDGAHRVTHTIACIELSNLPSRRAEARNGGQLVGYAGYWCVGRLHWTFRSIGARRVGFRFRRAPRRVH